MSANSDKIVMCVKILNSDFWAFVEVARALGETRSTIVRKLIREYVKKQKKVLRQ